MTTDKQPQLDAEQLAKWREVVEHGIARTGINDITLGFLKDELRFLNTIAARDDEIADLKRQVADARRKVAEEMRERAAGEADWVSDLKTSDESTAACIAIRIRALPLDAPAGKPRSEEK